MGCGASLDLDRFFLMDDGHQTDGVVQRFDSDGLMRRLETEGRFNVKIQHWLGVIALLVVGYYVGTKYPNFWQKIGA